MKPLLIKSAFKRLPDRQELVAKNLLSSNELPKWPLELATAVRKVNAIRKRGFTAYLTRDIDPADGEDPSFARFTIFVEKCYHDKLRANGIRRELEDIPSLRIRNHESFITEQTRIDSLERELKRELAELEK